MTGFSKKGFTLIELLVVIAIIGILISVVAVALSGARRQARDDRRVADLRQVQQALQLYFLKCRMYPGQYDPDTNDCLGGNWVLNPNPATFPNPANWQALETALLNAKIGIPNIPNDPVPGRDYSYYVQLGSGVITPKAQCYVLRTQMETTGHRALNDLKELDVDDFSPGTILPLSCSINSNPGCKLLYPQVTDTQFCDDDPSRLEYCVGNSNCFYGN